MIPNWIYGTLKGGTVFTVPANLKDEGTLFLMEYPVAMSESTKIGMRISKLCTIWVDEIIEEYEV